MSYNCINITCNPIKICTSIDTDTDTIKHKRRLPSKMKSKKNIHSSVRCYEAYRRIRNIRYSGFEKSEFNVCGFDDSGFYVFEFDDSGFNDSEFDNSRFYNSRFDDSGLNKFKCHLKTPQHRK